MRDFVLTKIETRQGKRFLKVCVKWTVTHEDVSVCSALRGVSSGPLVSRGAGLCGPPECGCRVLGELELDKHDWAEVWLGMCRVAVVIGTKRTDY